MKDKENKTRRARLLLLTGQKFSVRELNRRLDVNNSPEIVRNLRKEMDIRTEWKTSENGTRFGVYYYVKPPKQSRISTRQYMDQAYSKKI